MNNNLLSSAEFAEIRDTLNDVMFTFLKLSLIYKKDRNTATRWMRDVETQRDYDDINLNCLVVWGTTDSEGKFTPTDTGANDFTSGYILLRYDDLLALNLIDSSKNLTTTPPQDKIQFNGIIYLIEGVVMVGQLEDTNVAVKLFFKKDLKPE